MFKKYLFFGLCFIVFGSYSFNVCRAAGIPAPTLISVSSGENQVRTIVGLTKTNTDVFIFLDGLFVGSAQVKQKRDTDASSFVYYLSQDLKTGNHTITALARDSQTFVASSYSKPATITVGFTPSSNIATGSTENVPAPILISPDVTAVIGKSRPTITGLTIGGSNVEIYIDGQYAGDTGTTTSIYRTANFAFIPTSDLSVGRHQVYAIAKNDKSERSSISELLSFYIEDKLPAPTLTEPITDENNPDKPFIVGLVRDQSKVFVYIDDKLAGQAKIENKKGDVVSFVYQPALALTKGGHLIYTVAIDQRGKESDRSNYVYYLAGESAEPMITDQAEEESGGSINDQDEKAVDELAGILKSEEEKEENDGAGMINETKENIASLKWNVVIFLSFLLAVIVWIFWVNRELIKEKRKQNQAETGEENKQDKLI